MIWQGWLASVSPLITGTEACSAISLSVAGSKVRIITRSTKRDSTRAVSAMVSPWPSCISPPESTSVSPPSCRTPTSKLTRVRVEGFSKTSATTRPASAGSASGAPRGRPARAAFMAPAASRIALSSAAGVV